MGEFSHQAESFNRSQAANAPETLAALVELADPGPASAGWRPRAGRAWWRARWRRARAPCTASTSRRRWWSWRGARPRAENATFSVGDATALADPDGAYDGAIARFTLHHVPVPARLVEELARVVRPGGAVVLADHLLDEDPAAAAWSAEIERLRDPSHWASLPLERLRALGAGAGLELEREEVSPLALDLGDWLERGSGTASGPGAAGAADDRAARGRAPLHDPGRDGADDLVGRPLQASGRTFPG